jgi:hypothetical protein
LKKLNLVLVLDRSLLLLLLSLESSILVLIQLSFNALQLLLVVLNLHLYKLILVLQEFIVILGELQLCLGVPQALVLVLYLVNNVIAMLIQALQALNLFMELLDLCILSGPVSARGSPLFEILVLLGKLLRLLAFDLVVEL